MTPANDLRTRFLEFRRRLYGDHDLTAVDDFLHPEFRSHAAHSRIEPGIAGYKAFAQGFHTGLPDLRPVDQQVLVEGDRLMAMARWQATHTGPFRGVAATGKPLHFATADLYTLRDGLLHEHWDVADRLDAWIALGLVRPAAA